MVKVVYFNQWFSSIANVIEDLKEKHGDKIKIIASSRNKDHAYKDSVDVFIVEDWKETSNKEESMTNYVNWVLNLCEKYKVDYFFVKKHAKYITQRKRDFSALDCFLISEDYETLTKLDNKSDVYKMLENTELRKYIPEYNVYNNAADAASYIHKHRGKNDICLKFNSDEGGTSFRAINDDPITLNSLYGYRVNTISTSDAIQLTAHAGNSINKLIFMEMLDSPEISVDCYNSKKGFIAICREKEGGRREKIYYNQGIFDICQKIGEELNLLFPFNVQFRFKQGKSKDSINNLRLLEINPRMSGGLYYEVFNGLNIAEICLMDMMNMTENYSLDNYIDFEPKYVAHLEKAIHLSE